MHLLTVVSLCVGCIFSYFGTSNGTNIQPQECIIFSQFTINLWKFWRYLLSGWQRHRGNREFGSYFFQTGKTQGKYFDNDCYYEKYASFGKFQNFLQRHKGNGEFGSYFFQTGKTQGKYFDNDCYYEKYASFGKFQNFLAMFHLA